MVFAPWFQEKHKEDLLKALIGMGTGLLSRKLIIGKANGFVGKTVGKVIQWGMTGMVSKNADKIKEKASEIIDRFFRKHKATSNHIPVAIQNRIRALSKKSVATGSIKSLFYFMHET